MRDSNIPFSILHPPPHQLASSAIPRERRDNIFLPFVTSHPICTQCALEKCLLTATQEERSSCISPFTSTAHGLEGDICYLILLLFNWRHPLKDLFSNPFLPSSQCSIFVLSLPLALLEHTRNSQQNVICVFPCATDHEMKCTPAVTTAIFFFFETTAISKQSFRYLDKHPGKWKCKKEINRHTKTFHHILHIHITKRFLCVKVRFANSGLHVQFVIELQLHFKWTVAICLNYRQIWIVWYCEVIFNPLLHTGSSPQ